MSNTTAFVFKALDIGALELLPEGRVLKSGRISPYFFNSGLFHTGSALSSLVAVYAYHLTAEVCDSNLEKLRRSNPILFGPAYKGIPLIAGLAVFLETQYQVSLGYACNRKEVKDHGEGGDLIGHSLEGKEVIIVDDVITSGSSIDESVSFVQRHGGIPRACLIAFDRQEQWVEGGRSAVQEVQERHNIPVLAAATLTDLIAVLEKDTEERPESRFPLAQVVLPKIRTYRDRYGV